MDPVLIGEKVVEEKCHPGEGGATCIFLVLCEGGFACAKGSCLDQKLRQRRANGATVAKSDNCSGPPNFTLPADRN